MSETFTEWPVFASERTEHAKAERVWRDALEPALSSREAGRAEHIRSTISRTVMVGVLIGVPVLVLLAVTMGWDMVGPLTFFALALCALAAFGVNALRWIRVFSMHVETKDLILKSAAGLYGFEYDSLSRTCLTSRTSRH